MERRIRDERVCCNPYRQHCDSIETLQVHTDARRRAQTARRTCPATSTSVLQAWEQERSHLSPLPAPLLKPFDIAVTRRVAADCTVALKGRTYSGPFALIGQRIEVRGHHDQRDTRLHQPSRTGVTQLVWTEVFGTRLPACAVKPFPH